MSGCNEVGQFGLTVVINYTHNPANERKVDFPTVNRRWGMMQDSFQSPYSSESSSGNRESCSPDQRATSLENLCRSRTLSCGWNPRPALALGWCREGELTPTRGEPRRILRAWKRITGECP